MVSVMLMFVVAVAFATAVASYPLTQQEQIIAKFVKTREDRVASGDISSEISARTYTVDSLQSEMLTWWVDINLVGQSAAIEQFVSLMQDAKEVADKKSWFSVVSGWIDVVIAALSPEFDLIQLANDALKQSVETLQTAAEQAENEQSDFFKAAMSFREALPTETTKSFAAVDGFINGVREVTSDPDGALLQAYSQVTQLIAKTNSFRRSFNQYYLSFLKGALLAPGDATFDYFIDHDGNSAIAWPGTPRGLDACTVADYLHQLNLGYVSSQTPGFEDIDMRVIYIIPTPYADENDYGVRYSCSNYESLDQAIDCWVEGSPEHRVGTDCDELANKVRKWGSEWPKGQTWPTDGVKDFCSEGIGPSTKYMAWLEVNTFMVSPFFEPVDQFACSGSRSEASVAPLRNATMNLLMV